MVTLSPYRPENNPGSVMQHARHEQAHNRASNWYANTRTSDNDSERDAARAGLLARQPALGGPGATSLAAAATRRTNAAASIASGPGRDGLRTPGRQLDAPTRRHMEGAFGHRFDHIRVHTDERAQSAALRLNAKAYAVGHDIVFGPGEYRPHTSGGRQLIGHELAHTMQQHSGRPRVQRNTLDKRDEKDPLCENYSHDGTRALAEIEAAALGADPTKIDHRMALIRTLKLVRRCATEGQQAEVRTTIAPALGAELAGAVWAESARPFSGFVGLYPGYASDIKRRLDKLGASETLKFSSFGLEGGATHRSRAKRQATRETGDLARTDIVYFRGHQYAQYRAPGVFTNGKGTFGFDLRYIQRIGGFPNVKLMISTSCATLCKEAIELFTGLFPNAVILGYRKSAPIDGAAVRNAFQSQIMDLDKPLLLDQPVDVNTVVDTWKGVIEAIHAGHRYQLPGYYRNGVVHYWDGTAWDTIGPSDATNSCRRKGDESSSFPAPAP